MNRKKIREGKISLEKKLTVWGIRADKLDATITRKKKELEILQDGTPEFAALNIEVARLSLQLIKVNAEYDSFVREHNRLTDVNLANRKTHVETGGSVQSHKGLQPT